ncbi:MAG TPA: SusD/RagB family nutrient-binding outer membrane lipoprotein [Chitinophagaceae bacterium]|nr:SusD/RagB family nutrient-binding outer membrane lipoprotein [Chitinophagaceae bacterium]
MKNNVIIFLFAFFLLSSCKKNLSEVNLNPNAPEKVDPQFLLANVIYQSAKNNAEEGWKNGNLLAQHTSNIEFFPIDRYDVGTNTELWNATYRMLNDLYAIENAANTNQAYKGVALILRSTLGSLLTDLWGDVPYFQATKGASDKNFAPAYDKQQDIYTGENGILANLDKAITVLGSTTDVINGDILYKGDLTKWVRLANSLKVRYLIRISKKQNVSTQLQAILSQNKLLRSNADNAVIPFLSSAPNQWFLINEREGRYADVRMSKTSENILNPLNDARTSVFFKPTVLSVSSGMPAFKGLPNGLSKASQNAFNFNDISLIGRLFRDEPIGVNAPIMTYAELQFLLAEAAQKSLIPASATAYYEEGIKSSHAYYGIAVPANYLANPNVTLNGTDDLKKIITQKWISNFLNGYEAWLDIRRTGFPQITIPQDNLNGNKFPVRFRYPATEQAANKTNYDAAVMRIGGDSYDSKGWWEN